MRILKNKSIFLVLIPIILTIALALFGQSESKKDKINVLISQGNEAMLEGRYNTAVTFYENALNKDSDNIEARIGLGRVYKAQKQYYNAEQILSEGVSIGSRKPDIYIYEAEVLALMGRDKEVQQTYKKGYEKTGDAGIKKAMDEMKKHPENIKTIVKSAVSNMELQNNEINGGMFTGVAAGPYQVIVIKEDGTILTWGYKNDYGQYTVPKGLKKVKEAAGGCEHAVVLKQDGTVIAWGKNDFGQCSVPKGLKDVKAIAAGDFHSLALKNDGMLVVWGRNDKGECSIPAGLKDVKAIAAKGEFSAALKGDGTVVVWGDNSSGQCNVPAGLKNVKAIAAGGSFMMALKEDGTLIEWGDNSSGQCNVPAGLKGIKAIAAGTEHSVVMKENGEIMAWGDTSYAQTSIPGGFKNIKKMTAGRGFTIALKNDGSIVIWSRLDFLKVPASMM